MNTKLLGGASILVLALGLSAGAVAQTNEANDNHNVQAASQNSNGDAVAAHGDAVVEGAIATAGNALGENADNIAAASNSSTATQVDATDADAVATNNSAAADDGAVVVGNGVALGDNAGDNAIVGGDGVALYGNDGIASDGSAVHVGDHNSSATAEEESAAANANSTAIWARFDIADEGSAVVVGDNNSTAAADDGGASVGGSGTAVGVTDVSVGGFDNFVTLNGGFGGGTDDATLAFGKDNIVASAHLDSTVSGLVLAINYDGNETEDEYSTTVATGPIWGNSVSSAAGANRVVYNTGIANQGRALAVAGTANFNSQ